MQIEALDAPLPPEFNANIAKYEARARELYLVDKAAFTTPAQVSATHILFDTKKRGAEPARKLAIETRAKLAAGADMGKLAREVSDDPSSSQNAGTLGWFSQKEMDPSFAAAAFALANVGDLSEPVQSQFGWHIIRLDGKRAGTVKSYEEARDQIMAGAAQAGRRGKARGCGIGYPSRSEDVGRPRRCRCADPEGRPGGRAAGAGRSLGRRAAAGGQVSPRGVCSRACECHRTPQSRRVRERAGARAVPQLPARELFTRYLGSVTGLAWAFVHPLVLLVVYHFVFTTDIQDGALRQARASSRSSPCAVAVACRAGGHPARRDEPRQLRGPHSQGRVPARARRVRVGQRDADLQFAGYVVVLAALVCLRRAAASRGCSVAIPLWIVMAIGVVGITLFFAALQVFVRDVEHVLMPALMILMYLTPILYPLKLVPESMRPWVAVNPFSWLVGRLREALIDGRLALQWGDAIALVVAIALFAGGRWVFRRLSPHFEDFV
jgi:ABC-type polysaccharide/polyol phosphate export permease